MDVTVRIAKVTPAAKLPTKGTVGAAAYDFYAAENCTIPPGERRLVGTGLKVEIPNGWQLRLSLRSGSALKTPLIMANAPGIIDCITGDTEIPLLDGTCVRIEDLYVQQRSEFWVYALDQKSNYHPGRAHSVVCKGKRKILCITTDAGTTLKCTPEHLIRMWDGTFKAAKDLQPGMSLAPFRRSLDKNGYEVLKKLNPKHRGWDVRTQRMVAVEFYTIDKLDVHHKDKNKKNNLPDNLIPVTAKEHTAKHPERIKKLRDWHNTSEGQQHAKQFGERVAQHPNRLNALKDNENMRGWEGKEHTPEYKQVMSNYMKNRFKQEGFFNNCKEQMQRFNASEQGKANSILQLQRINRNRGVAVVKQLLAKQQAFNEQTYETNRVLCQQAAQSKSGIVKYATLLKLFDNSVEAVLKAATNCKVVSVEYLPDKEAVYDLTVDKYHNFAANGLFVHNCDYRGVIGLILLNTSTVESVIIACGDRLAQGVFVKAPSVSFTEVGEEELSTTERAAGGFGSTGTK